MPRVYNPELITQCQILTDSGHHVLFYVGRVLKDCVIVAGYQPSPDDAPKLQLFRSNLPWRQPVQASTHTFTVGTPGVQWVGEGERRHVILHNEPWDIEVCLPTEESVPSAMEPPLHINRAHLRTLGRGALGGLEGPLPPQYLPNTEAELVSVMKNLHSPPRGFSTD